MSRILVVGDAAATGFGTVTLGLGTRLISMGEDVRFISQNDTGQPHALSAHTYKAADGISRGFHPAQVIQSGFDDGWTPEACIVLGDYASVRYVLARTKEMLDIFASIPTFHYCPVEGVDLPPSWAQFWAAVHPVAMSRFGADEIAKVTGIRPPMVYHGVDTDDFYPVSISRPGHQGVTSKDGARRFFQGRPDAIIALRTDRHMPRKNNDALIRIFGPLLMEHEPLYLVLHCRPFDEAGNLYDTISKLPERVQAKVVLTGAHDTFVGMARPALNLLLNSADLYVSAGAEGFGLTLAESIACGVPVVGLDYSSVPEVIGPAGVTVPVAHLIDNPYGHYWAAPDEDLYREKVDYLVRHKAKREALGAMGPGHVRKNFSWDVAARQFSDLVNEALGRSGDVRPVAPSDDVTDVHLSDLERAGELTLSQPDPIGGADPHHILVGQGSAGVSSTA